MSLLPARFQFTDPLTSLGPKVVKEEAEKVDPIRDFEKGNHGSCFWEELKKAKPLSSPQERTDAFCERHAPKREPVMWKFLLGGFAYFYRKHASGEWEVKNDQISEDWVASGNGEKFFADLVSGKLGNVTPIYAEDSPPLQQEEGGWIEWKGGECPIPEVERGGYRLKFRDGRESSQHHERQADSYRWQHTAAPGDIVAYRVIL